VLNGARRQSLYTSHSLWPIRKIVVVAGKTGAATIYVWLYYVRATPMGMSGVMEMSSTLPCRAIIRLRGGSPRLFQLVT
jgi:hypothetical protein